MEVSPEKRAAEHLVYSPRSWQPSRQTRLHKSPQSRRDFEPAAWYAKSTAEEQDG